MDGWLTKLVENCAGEIVSDYDQGDDDRRGHHENGWCNGAVTHWLRCKRMGIDFWPWFATSEGASSTRSVMTRAKMLKADVPGHPDPACGTAAATLESYGMRMTYYGETMALRGRSLGTEISMMQGGGRFNFIAMFGNAGGHAVGAVWGSVSLSFFDPNVGELAMPRDRASDFFPMFLTWSTGAPSRCARARARPPPRTRRGSRRRRRAAAAPSLGRRWPRGPAPSVARGGSPSTAPTGGTPRRARWRGSSASCGTAPSCTSVRRPA